MSESDDIEYEWQKKKLPQLKDVLPDDKFKEAFGKFKKRKWSAVLERKHYGR